MSDDSILDASEVYEARIAISESFPELAASEKIPDWKAIQIGKLLKNSQIHPIKPGATLPEYHSGEHELLAGNLEGCCLIYHKFDDKEGKNVSKLYYRPA